MLLSILSSLLKRMTSCKARSAQLRKMEHGMPALRVEIFSMSMFSYFCWGRTVHFATLAG